MRNQAKKAFSLLLALVMCLSVMSVGAFADYEVTDRATSVSSLEDLQTALSDESVETITVTAMIPINSDTELNLNGKHIVNMVANNRLFRVGNASFTINGQNATITTPDDFIQSYGFVDMRNASGTAYSGAKLIINDTSFYGTTSAGSLFAYRTNGQEMTFNNVNVTVPYGTGEKYGGYAHGYTFSIVNGYQMQVKLTVVGGVYTYESRNDSAGVFQAGVYDTTYYDQPDATKVYKFDGVTVNANYGPILETHGDLTEYKNCTFTLGYGEHTRNTSNTSSYLDTAIATALGGTLNVETGMYSGSYGAYVWSSGGTMNISGGSFTGTSAALYAQTDTKNYPNATATINVTGGNFDGAIKTSGKATITISGGSFSHVSFSKGTGTTIAITGGTFDADPTAYLAEGYTVTESNGIWTVAAKSYVAQIGDDKYESLADAIAHVEKGQTITLLDDVELTETVVFEGKDLTLDLNGCNITAPDARALWVKTGKVEITGSGIIEANPSDGGKSVIRVGDGNATNIPDAAAELTIGEDVTVKSSTCYGVTIFGSNLGTMVDGIVDGKSTKVNSNEEITQRLTVNGTVEVTGGSSAISGNGNGYNARTEININAGAVVSSTLNNGIYHPQAGNLNINGGSVTGKTAIEMKSGVGTVAVSGNAVITATGSIADSSSNNNGTSSSGYAIAAVENSGYKGGGKVYIDGGTFTGPVGIVVDKAYGEADADKKPVVLKSTGYTGNLAITADFEWSTTEAEDGYYKLVAKPVAQIAAVAAVKGTTLMSLKELITDPSTDETSTGGDVTGNYSMTATSSDIKIVNDGSSNSQISIPAKDMGALITFTDKTDGKVKNLKMETYLNEIIKDENSTTEAVTNAKATLDYGIAASHYFNTSMVTKDYSQTNGELTAAKTALEAETSTFTAPTQDADSPFKFIGVSLLLDGATTLRLNFQGNPTGQTVSCGNVQYTYHGETYDVDAINYRNADYYYIDVKTNIAPGYLGEKVSVTFDGGTIEVSALDYCKLALEQNNTALAELATALYRCYLVATSN